jgi:hypothetical protein
MRTATCWSYAGRSELGTPRARARLGGRARSRELAIARLVSLARSLRAGAVMDADTARKTLVAQHDRLRAHLEGCRVLARRVLGGEPAHGELDAALAQLRDAFVEYNASEQQNRGSHGERSSCAIRGSIRRRRLAHRGYESATKTRAHVARMRFEPAIVARTNESGRWQGKPAKEPAPQGCGGSGQLSR